MLGSTSDGRTDGLTANRTPISHLAKAGATKMTAVCSLVFLVNLIRTTDRVLIHFQSLTLFPTFQIVKHFYEKVPSWRPTSILNT